MAECHTSEITVVTRGNDLGSRQQFSRLETEAVDRSIGAVTIHRLGADSKAKTILQLLRREVQDCDIVYLNSLWSPLFTVVPLLFLLSRPRGRPAVLLAPRGELAAGALGIKSRKKRFALPVLRRISRSLDIVWHVSSQLEKRDVERFLARPARAIVRTNPAPPVISGTIELVNQRLTIAFIARMVPVKNFLLVVRALNALNLSIRVIVAGAIEDEGYWVTCTEAMADAHQDISYEVRGHVNDTEVSKILDQSDAMVLPTLSENFGRSIAESLAAGCPVLIPDTTLWTDVVRAGAGWIIATDDPEPLTSALAQLAQETHAERLARRQRTQQLYSQWWDGTQANKTPLFLSREVLAAGCIAADPLPPIQRRAREANVHPSTHVDRKRPTNRR